MSTQDTYTPQAQNRAALQPLQSLQPSAAADNYSAPPTQNFHGPAGSSNPSAFFDTHQPHPHSVPAPAPALLSLSSPAYQYQATNPYYTSPAPSPGLSRQPYLSSPFGPGHTGNVGATYSVAPQTPQQQRHFFPQQSPYGYHEPITPHHPFTTPTRSASIPIAQLSLSQGLPPSQAPQLPLAPPFPAPIALAQPQTRTPSQAPPLPSPGPYHQTGSDSGPSPHSPYQQKSQPPPPSTPAQPTTASPARTPQSTTPSQRSKPPLHIQAGIMTSRPPHLEGAASSAVEPSPVKTRFPTARIKRIMQADEEVGKVAQQTPIAVGKALELFMIALVQESASVARRKGQKRVSAQMLKEVVEHDDQWDFLREIVAKASEAEDKPGRAKAKAETDSDEDSEPKKKRGGGRRKKSAAE